MTDAIAVFPPGFRWLDASGDPISGGTFNFYDAGTTTPRTVYSNYGLSSSLGTVVYVGSSGLPVASSGSSTAVSVYTGSTAYKVIAKDGSGTTLLTLDNIKGALDTSTFLTTGSTSTLTIPVISKTGDYTILSTDRGKVVNADPSSGTFTLTLPSAVTVGDNWSIFIRNTGTANPVKIAGSQAISGPWTGGASSTTSFALENGAGCLIVSNGATFVIPTMSPAMLQNTVGIIRVADRVSAAPSSPTAGSRYIVTAAFSTFEQEDLIEADGAGSFFEITPPTDCGWIAYVQDEDARYQFIGSAWVNLAETAPTGVLGSYTALSSTSTTLSGIATNAKMVILNIVGMSWDASAALRIRIGPSGGVATTGYLSTQSYVEGGQAVASVAGTAGFDFTAYGATGVLKGSLIFTLADSATNTWVMSGSIAVNTSNTSVSTIAGSVPLSGVLEKITITTVAGTASADAGSVSALVYR